MHEAAFDHAARPGETVILKLPLQPFSLSHALSLCRVQSPFLTGGTPEKRHVIQAVLICHHTHAQLAALRRDPLAGLKGWLWGRRTRRENFALAIADFQNYVTAGTTEPPLDEVVSNGPVSRPPGAPALLQLLQFLIFHLRKTEAEAWDYPVGAAKWHFYAWHESREQVRIKSGFDYQADHFRARMDELEAAGVSVAEAIAIVRREEQEAACPAS